MQTFLPYPDFEASAKVLDYKRLGKQRVETYQLLTAVTGQKLMTKDPEDPRGKRDLPESDWYFAEFQGRWDQHLAAKMWLGHAEVLILYGIVICEEWIERGYNDTCLAKIARYWQVAGGDPRAPAWLGHSGVHASHRSNLLRKDYDYYSEYFPDEPDDLEYLWPVPKEGSGWRLQRGPSRR